MHQNNKQCDFNFTTFNQVLLTQEKLSECVQTFIPCGSCI
jgi:hypothetical protein